MSRTILVTGATGHQGGGLIKTLLASPEASKFRMIAVSRNPQSAAGKALEEKGVTVIAGDLNDVPGIFKSTEIAKQPIWGVFSVQVEAWKSSFRITQTKA